MSNPDTDIHHSHRDVAGGWLRAAVFGAMDGLVSNTALIAGMAGGAASSSTIVLAGSAGLTAGALSMAAGELVSVRSQNEMTLAEVEVERRELERHPEEELDELAQRYVRRGVDVDLARTVAEQISADPERAVQVHAMAELGVDPRQLPSAWLAAGSSFCAFAVGALVPLAPYLLGATSLPPSLLLAALGLFATGALVSRVTTRSWWFAGGRQLLIGAAAASVTYLLGRLVDVGLG